MIVVESNFLFTQAKPERRQTGAIRGTTMKNRQNRERRIRRRYPLGVGWSARLTQKPKKAPCFSEGMNLALRVSAINCR